ncbi:uncharacterized protein PHACADRAFT_194590 [Phanerochaete carnosa HHB-10118-sp]|uniref:AMP-dependent synthetase/ligase domain-containing protein n=1 Tax=Phanerochaete carnosa (strain HHB-10118-sp) TaxID=650164 RepID=K5WCN0_PHACS|nr:uncharacterized protein PHACADRAFT_194590 [Phanerochaete carnosa HHB-10118-sp]EKM57015.1 hypothetical protein PHACADRAFT_194590 [Phanerochaete carnosa HHB-10118-sp]
MGYWTSFNEYWFQKQLHDIQSGEATPRSAKQWKELRARSYVEGPTDPPLCHLTLPAYFAQKILPLHADCPALTCRIEEPNTFGGSPQKSNKACLDWTFRKFDDHIAAVARGLLAMSVNKGNRVGVIMGNNSTYAMLQWACARIGAILVTLNPAYRTHELIATLGLVGVKRLFLVPRIRSSAYLQNLADAFPSLVSSSPGNVNIERLPDLKNIVVLDDLGGAQGAAEMARAKSAIDFCEILVWRHAGPEQRKLEALERGLQQHETINLQFTSDTTGAPKAVSLTHHNLLNNGIQIGRCMHLTPSDVLCMRPASPLLPRTPTLTPPALRAPGNVPPLFHCFGLVLGNLTAWMHSARIVYSLPVFNAHAIVDALLAERPSTLHSVPMHFLGILAEVAARKRELGTSLVFDQLRGVRPFDVACFRVCVELMGNARTGIAAGSSILTLLMQTLVEKLNLTELTITYGMTETSLVSFQTVPSDPLIMCVESVGCVHPHVKAKIIAADRKHVIEGAHQDKIDEIMPIGMPGKLLVSGYLLQAGYWNDPKQTAQVMRRDANSTLWMHTGNEGVMDEDGYLRIVGRIKDIIICGGENLFPVAIENVLTAHAGIHEAAVVAVPDARLGEVVSAWVLREPSAPAGVALSAADMRQVVAQGMNLQNAPAYMWFVSELPEEVRSRGEEKEKSDVGGVRKFMGLPKTASGKVMKHVLRAWARELAEKGLGRVGA